MHLKHRGTRTPLRTSPSILLLFVSYPLILSVELQCSVSQQERLAQLLIEIFGNKISLDHHASDAQLSPTDYRPLPSPNDLRGKIIIKVANERASDLFLSVPFFLGQKITSSVCERDLEGLRRDHR